MFLASTVRLFPSAESFMVAVLMTFPLTFSVLSQAVGFTLLYEIIVPHGVGTSLPSVLKVQDWPDVVTFMSPPAACSYVMVCSPKSLFATFNFHLPTYGASAAHALRATTSITTPNRNEPLIPHR